MDLSPLVAWSIPALACAVTAVFGVRDARPDSRVGAGAALGLALGVAFLFMLVQALLHGTCVEAKLCKERGDGNMSYWFQSFILFPIYWLIYYTTANSKT